MVNSLYKSIVQWILNASIYTSINTSNAIDLISGIVHLEILAFILFPVYCILYFGTYCDKKSEEDIEKKF